MHDDISRHAASKNFAAYWNTAVQLQHQNSNSVEFMAYVPAYMDTKHNDTVLRTT